MISREFVTWVSWRRARNLSNMALDIMGKIHDENFAGPRKVLWSYILQIDGAVNRDFALIVVVRDSISGFVLHSEKYLSESEEIITATLNSIKGDSEFLCTISDVRACKADRRSI